MTKEVINLILKLMILTTEVVNLILKTDDYVYTEVVNLFTPMSMMCGQSNSNLELDLTLIEVDCFRSFESP